MNDDSARAIAMYTYREVRNRFGDPVIEHVARVAAAVPEPARPIAWLHEVFEVGDTEAAELLAAGLTDAELDALTLLTKSPAESYEAHVLGIAHARGDAGRLARAVKLADLEDHLAHPAIPVGAPPYAWARRHIDIACWHTRSEALSA